jgi:hypothetical protein
MKVRLTISVTDDEYMHIKTSAKKAGVSMSKYMAQAAKEKNNKQPAIDLERQSRQRAAIESILAGPKWDVTTDGRMPTADERNSR